MTIKQQGGIFGRNPTFNDLTVEGTFTTSGTTGVVDLIADDVITAGGTTVTHGANSDGTIRVEGSSAPSFAINDTGQSKEYFLTALGDFVQMRYADAGDTGGFANSTSLFTMKATGDVTVDTGNLVIGTSGKGIDFSATSGTGTSELFDDYEEGTWTPTQNGTATLTSSLGLYTKIGRMVQLQFYLTYSSTGTADIGGLPFTVNASAAQPLAVLRENNTQGTLWQGRLNNTTTTMIIRRYDNANLAVTNGILVGSCTYTV